MNIDLVAYGDAVIDLTPYDSDSTFIRNFGGSPANFSLAFRRMGGSPAFFGTVGEDLFGHYLADTLQENKVNTQGVVFTDDAVTTMAFVQLQANGERDFVFVRKPGADMFYNEADINFDVLNAAQFFHFSSVSLSLDNLKTATLRMVDTIKNKGGLISFDMNYRPIAWKNKQAAVDAVLEHLDCIDLLKLSDDEAFMLTGASDVESAFKFFENKNLKIVVITCGREGAYCLYQGKVYFQKGYSVDALDATGAGDAFWGTFVYLIFEAIQKSSDDICLTDAVIENALKHACVSGALTTTGKGVIGSIPTVDEIKNFLDNN